MSIIDERYIHMLAKFALAELYASKDVDSCHNDTPKAEVSIDG